MDIVVVYTAEEYAALMNQYAPIIIPITIIVIGVILYSFFKVNKKRRRF